MMNKRSAAFLFLFLILTLPVFAQVSLPRLVSDGMVLQRDADVKIWGWASADEGVTVHFLGETHQTRADGEGEWEITLARLEAGGPYEMIIEASNTVTIEDILIGDVWVASGQSNIELPMRRVAPLYQDVIDSANYPEIRYFEVPKRYNFKTEETDLISGHWQRASPESVQEFSAVALFFAKSIQHRFDVPVGIILSGLGGSPAEAWISENALKDFPDHYEEAQRFKDDELIADIEREDQQRSEAWHDELNQNDTGLSDPNNTWYEPDIYTEDWERMSIPGYWADTETGAINGAVWFQKKLTLDEEWSRNSAKLELGVIVDADSVFVNGTFVGNTTYQYPPRWYDVPQGVLTEGENTISVRVINQSGKGGFIPDKPYELTTETDTVNLKGEWKYKVGAEMDPLPGQTFVRWKPVGLFNAMISPLLKTSIKGVIWYQGESNTGRPDEYRELFPALINNWRQRWGIGDFPFLYVQLANYMEPRDEPTESNWAELRDAQLQTLSLPNTGMAVAIDIGEWNDIHPLNKRDVGERLAASAFGVAYNENVVQSGPIYDSMDIDGHLVTLSFLHTGSGLTAKGEELREFAVSGPDGQFVWANARIDGDRVIVSSDAVPDPVAVRYAWADNPENANLYNKEGFPASPFRARIGRSKN